MMKYIENWYQYYWVVLESRKCPNFGTFLFQTRFLLPSSVCNEASVRKYFNSYRWGDKEIRRMGLQVKEVIPLTEDEYDAKLDIRSDDFSVSWLKTRCIDAWNGRPSFGKRLVTSLSKKVA